MLDVVDLDGTEQAVYEAIVEDPPATIADLEKVLGVDGHRLQATLATLEAKGLVSRAPGTPTRFVAAPPDVALEVLLLEKEEQVKRARLYAKQLATRYHETTATCDPAHLVEVVVGRAAVMQRVAQVQRSARHEIRGLDKPPYAQRPTADIISAEEELLRRGVRWRVIYDSAGLVSVHDLRGDVEAGISAGEEARVLPNAPTKLVLADDRIGLIPLQTAPRAIESMVVVHPSALLDALGALFESLWERALPLSIAVASQPAASLGAPTAEEARLLTLLTTGIPDEAIAKQLGLSYRTFQRRLRDLLLRLGAATRFQAALRASALGWIAPPDRPAETDQDDRSATSRL